MKSPLYFRVPRPPYAKLWRKLAIRRKKKTTYKEQDKQKVEEYINKIGAIHKDRLVYLDETGIDSYMYRPRAWSYKGRYIYEKLSGLRYRRVGTAAALCGGNIVEPMQYDETMDAYLFETCFQKLLCHAFDPGKVLEILTLTPHNILNTNTTNKYL